MKLLIVALILIVLSTLGYLWFTPTVNMVNARKYGQNCKYRARCDDLVAIDCGAAMDGPLYYVRRSNGEVIEKCGGALMDPKKHKLSQCPPPEWKCSN